MAAKRGKSQARRNNGGGNDAIPGWAWLVLGLLLAAVVYLVGSKYLGGEKNDFFRLQPNPDAQPAPVAEGEEAVAPEEAADAATKSPAGSGKAAGKGEEADEEYDFYHLLPGKEVPMSDAELAATARDEAQRLEAQRKAEAAARQASPDKADDTLPAPVDANDGTAPAASASTPATAPATTPPRAEAPADARAAPAPAAAAASTTKTDDTARYLLQAGAFEASGQAEELKARIAMLGLGARVESAQISGKTVYRVRMGPYGTAGDLSDAKRKLSAGGLPAMAIKVK